MAYSSTTHNDIRSPDHELNCRITHNAPVLSDHQGEENEGEPTEAARVPQAQRGNV